MSSTSASVVHIAPTSEPEPIAAAPPARPWPLAARLGFRFLVGYWVLLIIPWPLGDLIPPLGGLYNACFDAVVPWIGHHLFRIGGDIANVENGSGDRTVDWVYFGACFALAALLAVAWSIVDRRRARYDRLHEGLRIVLRYYLAGTMFGYGIIKLFGGQFPAPPAFRLVATYADSSPMGLMWTFMGASKAYVMFSGAGETLGGALLLFRRTTTLGALVVAAVMTNVFVLNLCYDVPVKLFSSTLLSMALFLVLPDARRLADVLVRQRPTAPRPLALLLPRRWMRVARVVAKVGFIGFLLFGPISTGRQADHNFFQPKTFLDGVWDLERLERDGADVPLLAGEPTTWRRVEFIVKRMTLWRMDGGREAFWQAAQDEAKNVVTVTPVDDHGQPLAKAAPATLAVERVDHDHVVVRGTLAGHATVLRLRRLDTSKSLLMTRGFHWINEAPFNR